MSDKLRKFTEDLFTRLKENDKILKAFSSSVSDYISCPGRADAFRWITYIKNPEKQLYSHAKSYIEGISEYIVPSEERILPEFKEESLEVKNLEINHENQFDLSKKIFDHDKLMRFDEIENEDEEAYYYYNYERASGFICPDIPVKSLETQEESFIHFDSVDSGFNLVILLQESNFNERWKLSYVQKVFERNPSWLGNLKIFAIYYNQDIQSVDQGTYANISTFWIKESNYKKLAKELCSDHLNLTYILVYKAKVMWLGSPNDRNWENYINCLIEGKHFDSRIPTLEEGIVQDFNHAEHRDMMLRGHKKWNEFKQKYAQINPPNLRSTHDFRMEIGLEPVSNFKFSVFGKILRKYHQAVDDYVADLSEIFPNISNNIEFTDSITIYRGSFCNICSNYFPNNQIQYFCMVCEPSHFHCEECHNKDGLEYPKLIHPHYFYMILPDSKGLDEVKYGKGNDFSQIEEDGSSGISCCSGFHNHYAQEGQVTGNWYKCVHCKSFDFCEACFNEWQESNESSILRSQNLHLRNHIWAVRYYSV